MFKRVFDFVFALVLLLLFSPLMLLVMISISLTLGTPFVFVQERPGFKGKIFRMYKFRTMRNIHLDNGVVAPDQERLTRLGNFLRKTSLDELPQLLNVLCGQMSLVGPRPLLKEYLPLYSVEQMRRHDVLPGITGWAQIKGRNGLSWPEKFEFDLWYVDNQSFLLDLKVIGLTIMKCFIRKGETFQGDVFSTKFKGNNIP